MLRKRQQKQKDDIVQKKISFFVSACTPQSFYCMVFSFVCLFVCFLSIIFCSHLRYDVRWFCAKWCNRIMTLRCQRPKIDRCQMLPKISKVRSSSCTPCWVRHRVQCRPPFVLNCWDDDVLISSCTNRFNSRWRAIRLWSVRRRLSDLIRPCIRPTSFAASWGHPQMSFFAFFLNFDTSSGPMASPQSKKGLSYFFWICMHACFVSYPVESTLSFLDLSFPCRDVCQGGEECVYFSLVELVQGFFRMEPWQYFQ